MNEGTEAVSSNLFADPELIDDLSAIYGEKSGLFHNLVVAAGLNPATDFRKRDLRAVDLTGADLRGFDFTGSDLRGTSLRDAARFDRTTKVSGADLDPSDRDWLGLIQVDADQPQPDAPKAARGKSLLPERFVKLAQILPPRVDDTLRSDIEPFLLVGGNEGSVEIINLRDNCVVRKFLGHSESVAGLGIIDDGRKAFAHSKNGTISIWDVATGGLASQRSIDLQSNGQTTGRYYFLDGARVVTGFKNGSVSRIDLQDARQTTHQFDLQTSPFAVSTSAYGDLVVFAKGLWNVDTGQIREFERPVKTSHRFFKWYQPVDNSWNGNTSTFVKFADRARLLLRCRYDSFVELWDVANWRVIYRFPVVEADACYRATCAALSPDHGYILASSRKGTMVLMNVKNDELVWSTKAHRHEITDLKFSEDGRYVISISEDKFVRISATMTGVPIESFRIPDRTEMCPLVTNDGRFCVSLDLNNSVTLRRLGERRYLTLQNMGSFPIVRCAVLDSTFCEVSRELEGRPSSRSLGNSRNTAIL